MQSPLFQLHVGKNISGVLDDISVDAVVAAITEVLDADGKSTSCVITLIHNNQGMQVVTTDISRAEAYARFPIGATLKLFVGYPTIKVSDIVNAATGDGPLETSADDAQDMPRRVKPTTIKTEADADRFFGDPEPRADLDNASPAE